jgi:tRNA-2-methylthio-N6-dimethylallyladenosine synthase
MVTVFFKTYGCQANVADSQGLLCYLEFLGCEKVENEDQADLIVINTCAIREKAEQKMFSYVGQLAQYKKTKPYLKIGIIGCVASYRKQELYQRFDHINFVFGARDKLDVLQQYLFDAIIKLELTKQLYYNNPDEELRYGKQDRNIKKIVANNVSRNTFWAARKISERQTTQAALGGGVSVSSNEMCRSFVNITTGCNNYCTYCIVPFTRGREKSYPAHLVLDRIRKDVAAGAKEITLVGQNVNSYRCPETGKGFAQLLQEVAHIDGQFWVRYISPHPKDMNIDVLEVMTQRREKLCAWIHLPLQSGSDSILKAMNRTYTVKHFLTLVDSIRKYLPETTISTDIIVGFPGETESDYRATLEVMEAVRFDFMYSFIYSRRKYTKAYTMKDTCSARIKTERLEELQARQKDICFERNKAQIGETLRILIEKHFAHGRLLGRTKGNIRVVFDGDNSDIGSFAYATIQDAGPVNLSGVLVDESESVHIKKYACKRDLAKKK